MDADKEYPPGWFDKRTYVESGIESRATREQDIPGFRVKIGDVEFFVARTEARRLARHWLFPQDDRE